MPAKPARTALPALCSAIMALLLAPAASPAAPPRPGDVLVGPPVRLQGYDPQVQGRMTAHSEGFWDLLREEGGAWFVRWDEQTGLDNPRRRPRAPISLPLGRT